MKLILYLTVLGNKPRGDGCPYHTRFCWLCEYNKIVLYIFLLLPVRIKREVTANLHYFFHKVMDHFKRKGSMSMSSLTKIISKPLQVMPESGAISRHDACCSKFLLLARTAASTPASPFITAATVLCLGACCIQSQQDVSLGGGAQAGNAAGLGVHYNPPLSVLLIN